jgi:hypothetical protein
MGEDKNDERVAASDRETAAILDEVAPRITGADLGPKLAFHGPGAQKYADYLDRLHAEHEAKNVNK